MAEKHTAALVAESEEIPVLEGRVFVSIVDHGTPPPYLVWHPTAGVNTQDRVTGPRSTRNPSYTGHVVGETAQQVEQIMDLLEARLFPGGRGIVLDVVGESARPLMYSAPIPIQVDTDPQPTIVYGVVEVSWVSHPDPGLPVTL